MQTSAFPRLVYCAVPYKHHLLPGHIDFKNSDKLITASGKPLSKNIFFAAL
jgi:hypothetical protein